MPVVAIAGAIGAVASGTAAVAAGSLLMGGLQIAGGVLGAVGAFTGNKKLAKIGAIAGLAGFAGAAMTGSGGLFGGSGGEAAAAGDATGAFAGAPEASDAFTAANNTNALNAEVFSNPMDAKLSQGVVSTPLVQNNSLATAAPSSFKPTVVPASTPAKGMLSSLDTWTKENPTLSNILASGVKTVGEGLFAGSKLEEEMQKQKELALYKQQLTSSGLINSRPIVSTRY